MTPSVRLELSDSLTDLEALADAWRELPRVNANPLLTHDWFCAAVRTLHAGQRLGVVTAWRDERLVAVAPLVEVRRGPARWLEFIGSKPLYEPCELLYRDLPALKQLVYHLASLGLPIALQRVPADGVLAQWLTATGRGWLVRLPGPSCNRVDVKGTWQDYLVGRSSQCRAGFPHKRRRLAAGGTVRFEVVSPGPLQSDACLDEFVRVESAGWKLANGSALAARAPLQSFLREVSRRFAAQGQVRMHVLRCGEQIVAAQWLLEYGGRLWELKIGYDERWRATSPGRLLLWETLRDAFARRVDAYEFLGAGDRQQSDWVTSAQHLETLVWYPYSAAGLVAAATDAGHRLLHYARGST